MEMCQTIGDINAEVALLAEGVDRNREHKREYMDQNRVSPSSRRAWIEIFASALKQAWIDGRPPRGGRG